MMTDGFMDAYGRMETRRVILDIRENVERMMQQIMFEPSNEMTRREIQTGVWEYVDGLQRRGMINDYVVVCDESNNPPETIDRGALNLDVYIQPTAMAEEINLNFVTTTRGVSFDELMAEDVPKRITLEEIKEQDHFKTDKDAFKI